MNVKKSIDRTRDYPLHEEIIHSITHGMGVLLALAGFVLLIVRAAIFGTAWHIVSYAIFGFTLILLYLFSTLYHSLTQRTAKNVFARMDHAAIFLLIAGTYTPIMLTCLRGPWGWSMFGVVWAMALAGVVIRSIYLEKYRMLSTFIYVVMGWSFLIAYNQIITKIPPTSLRFLLYGGIAYTVGVLFYVWKKMPFTHAIWHLFVLAGSLLHFLAIYFLIGPR